MTKLYKCAKDCGAIEESDSEKIPTCCGVEMVEISESDLFTGCGGGCCAGCSGCGPVFEEDDNE